MRLVGSPVVGTILFLLGLMGALIVPSASVASTSTPVKAFMTLYGYADNSPPGGGIAHPCIHSAAGGTGTFQNPITFATDVNEVPWCTVIYVPFMGRYFIHEDECSQCDTDWNRFHLYRFDMWAGGDTGSLLQPERKALLACESTWTRGNSITDPDNPTVIVDPPANLPVVTQPIFSPPTSCWQPIDVSNPGNQTSSVGEGEVRLALTASDSYPGQSLDYQATGLPAGLQINPSSGTISGIPLARAHKKVTVTASDAYNSASVRFKWVVKAR